MNLHEEKLHVAARLEEDSEVRLLSELETIARVGRNIWKVFVAIVMVTALVVTAWFTMQYKLDQHDRAIRALWQQTFGIPLP